MEHPFGIEPCGNFYMRGGPNIRDAGLGNLSVLRDELLLEILGSGVLRAEDFARLSLVSKSLYCFANLEEHWKGLVIEELGGAFKWAGCWQRTYLVSRGLVPAGPRDDDGTYSASDEEVEDEKPPAAAGKAAEAGAAEQEAEEQGGKGKGKAKAGKGKGKGKGATAPAAAAEATASARDQRSSKRHRADAAAPAAPTTNGHGSSSRAKAKANTKSAAAAAAAAAAEADAVDAAGPGPSSTHAAAAAAVAAADGRRRRLMRRPPVGGSGGQRYLRVRGFYSDLLYQPWFCATVEVPPEWLEVDNIDRRSGLTPEQFRAEYEIPNRPVILTDVMASWPALGKWSCAHLASTFGERDVIVGNMPVPFSTYLAYSADCGGDESPLYLFDKAFARTSPELVQDYTVPEVFGEDLFSLLGEDGRPDYRWLILGPARSGSSFHVDPNATSAWNALLWGAKKWVLYPPGCPPPGVHPSPDGADVASPVSLAEWFVNFYAATKETKVRPIECVARPGELLFVPRGWWHCVLNLEESCALTQNYVSAVGLPQVLTFLKSRRPELVSGCALANRCDLYDRFTDVLRRERPALLEAVEARWREARAKAEETHKLACLFKPSAGESAPAAKVEHEPKRAVKGGAKPDPKQGTDAVTTGTCGGGGGGGFSFGFNFNASNPATPAATTSGGESGGAGAGFKFGFGL